MPNYRLYPEVQFPAFLQDNAAAIAWAIRNATPYGADPHDVFVVGHSAGAYNAAMLALDPAYLKAAGTSRDALAGVVGLAGPYDFLPITDPDIIPVFAPVQDGPASRLHGSRIHRPICEYEMREWLRAAVSSHGNNQCFSCGIFTAVATSCTAKFRAI